MSYRALLRFLLGRLAPAPKRPDFPPMRVLPVGRELSRGSAR